ncbi:MAG: NADH-quinone oxidoreductase subunit J [Candidatus Hydrothermales bacterium]
MKLIFFLILVLTALSGLMTVLTKDLFRSALYLGLTLFGTGLLYLFMGYDFVGWTQILVYVGGVVLLMIFTIMLAKESIMRPLENTVRNPFTTGLFALIIFLLLLLIGKTFYFVPVGLEKDVTFLPSLIFQSKYLIPFEILSILLLVAFMGAILLSKRE